MFVTKFKQFSLVGCGVACLAVYSIYVHKDQDNTTFEDLLHPYKYETVT